MNKAILTYACLTAFAVCPLSARSSADADNTSQNKQDRNGKLLTPQEQSNAEPDLRVVQVIRQTIVSNDGLSLNAKNIKVITNDKKVVLRGPVKSEQEKAIIAQIAKDNAGEREVENLIEIETQN